MDKAAEIANQLRDELENGLYKIGSRFPSDGELSDRFSAGTATVNKAVGKLKDMGYLTQGRSRRDGTRVVQAKLFPRGMICVILSPHSEFQNSILYGIITGALLHGYVSTPFFFNDSLAPFEKILAGRRFAGAINLTLNVLDTDLPVIYADVNNLDHIPNLHVVRGDVYNGAIQMINYLLKQKCHEIVICHQLEHYPLDNPRRRGFLDALRDAGYTDGRKRCFPFSKFASFEFNLVLNQIFSSYPDTDAIVCETDIIALHVRRILAERNLDRQIIVTGFGNLDSVQLCGRFPTVEQHPEEIGYRSVMRLLEMIRQPEIPQPSLEELPVELILPS